jgi:hypothetical protein
MIKANFTGHHYIQLHSKEILLELLFELDSQDFRPYLLKDSIYPIRYVNLYSIYKSKL